VVRAIEEIERDIIELSIEERNSLLRMLIAELDAPADAEVETAWLEESQRRYQELVEGQIKGIPGLLVLERLRLRLGQ
jgi:hypothetical protein